MLQNVHGLPVIRAPLLEEETWLQHGFGLKDISIEQYLKAYGLQATIPQTHQIHGCTVHVLDATSLKSQVSGPRSQVSGLKSPQGLPLEGDGFLSDQPGIVCWVRTADCLPILLADPAHKVVGAVHAGWKGTAQKAVLKAVEEMRRRWKSEPSDLKAALGPAIGGQCYQVQSDVAQVFEKEGFSPGPWMEKIDRRHWFLDIAFANQSLLESAGVPRERIYLSLACTACDLEKFHSFRKEEGKKGEQVSFILKREA